MPNLRGYERRDDKLLPYVSSQTGSNRVYDNDQWSLQSHTASAHYLHFMSWVTIQRNHEKPVREGFFQTIVGHWNCL